MSSVFEQMIHLKYDKANMRYNIRCWVPRSNNKEYLDPLHYANEIMFTLDINIRLKRNPLVIAEKLCKTHKMNACEVVDLNGNGGIFYRQWP